MVRCFVEGCVSAHLEARFKFNLSMVVTRFLSMISTLLIGGPEIYNNLLKDILAKAEHSLGEMQSVSSIVGSIMLVESLL
jgi:hypothetical protein